MLYESRKKIEQIVSECEKNLFERLSGELTLGLHNISINIGKEPMSGVQLLKHVLNKKRKYSENVDEKIVPGMYYKVNGLLKFQSSISGLEKKLAPKDLLSLLFRSGSSKDTFFGNDKLVFHISSFTKLPVPYIIVKCTAKNIVCFSDTVVDSKVYYSSDSSDPGILVKEIPIEALIKFEECFQQDNPIRGSAVYIEERYA